MQSRTLINGGFVFLHALNYKVTRRRVPLIVSLSLTTLCNLRCVFCYAYDNIDKRIQIETPRLLSYIDQFCDLGTRIFLLQGGEPTLNKDIAEIIAHVKSRGRYCRMSTNGMLVAKKIDQLRGLDQISFSLDGNETFVEKTRGKGVYPKVLEGMDAAREAGIPFEIHASLVRETAENEESIMHLFEIARRYGCQVSFCVTCVSGAKNTTEVGAGEMSNADIKAVFCRLIGYKEAGHPISNSTNSLRKSLNWPIDFGSIGYPDILPAEFEYDECRHGRLICWLDADGTLYPCPTTFYRPEFGVKLGEGTIAEAWEKLGSRVPCVACGGSDESTSLLALHYEDLKETLVRLVHNK